MRLRNNDRLKEAATVFLLNETLYPDDPRVITDLALTRLMLGDAAAAISGARHALDVSPDYEAAHELVAGVTAG